LFNLFVAFGHVHSLEFSYSGFVFSPSKGGGGADKGV
jgi:hypothetical protein